MTDNNPTIRNTGNSSSAIYTHHGIKHKQGYPVKIYGRPALAYLKDGQIDGFTYQDEINAAFENPDIPNYEPPLK